MAEPSQTLDLAIRVTYANGYIQATCQPTLHNFPDDALPAAGFHAMRALANALYGAIAPPVTGGTDVVPDRPTPVATP